MLPVGAILSLEYLFILLHRYCDYLVWSNLSSRVPTRATRQYGLPAPTMQPNKAQTHHLWSNRGPVWPAVCANS